MDLGKLHAAKMAVGFVGSFSGAGRGCLLRQEVDVDVEKQMQ